MKHIMKTYFKRNNHLNLLTLLTISFVVILLFVRLECNNDLDNTSLVTGDCSVSEMQVTFNPNPVSILPGETVQVAVEMTANSNCDDWLKRMEVEIKNEGIGQPYTHICTNYDLLNNSGICNIDVGVISGASQGTRQKQYRIRVYSDETSSESKKSILETLDIIVLSSPDFELSIENTIDIYEGRTTTYKHIGVTRVGNHNENITLSIKNKPDSVSFTFNPNPVPYDVDAVEMIMDAEYEAVPDIHPTTVVANDNSIEKEFDFDLEILNQYTISTNPENIIIAQDTSAILEVDIDWSHSEVYSEMVFTIEGSIIGVGDNAVEATFDPNPLPWGTFSNELTLEVGASVAPGTYPLTIKGATTNLEKSTVLQLVVTE